MELLTGFVRSTRCDGIAYFAPFDLRAEFTQGDSGSPGENLQFSAGVNIGVPAERIFGWGKHRGPRRKNFRWGKKIALAKGENPCWCDIIKPARKRAGFVELLTGFVRSEATE